MAHSIDSTLALINDLQDSGWNIEKLPAFSTNCGYTIEFSRDEFPGKTGFSMNNADFTEFACIGGYTHDGRLIAPEVDAGNEEQLQKFYDQFWIYYRRVQLHVPKHNLPRSETDEKHCNFAATVFSKFFRALPVTNFERRVKIGENWYGLEIRRSNFGVGAFVLYSKNNGKFSLTFDNFKITGYNCEGFRPQWVYQYIREAVRTMKG